MSITEKLWPWCDKGFAMEKSNSKLRPLVLQRPDEHRASLWKACLAHGITHFVPEQRRRILQMMSEALKQAFGLGIVKTIRALLSLGITLKVCSW